MIDLPKDLRSLCYLRKSPSRPVSSRSPRSGYTASWLSVHVERRFTATSKRLVVDSIAIAEGSFHHLLVGFCTAPRLAQKDDELLFGLVDLTKLLDEVPERLCESGRISPYKKTTSASKCASSASKRLVSVSLIVESKTCIESAVKRNELAECNAWLLCTQCIGQWQHGK